MRRAFYKWCALQCAAQRGETAASTARQLGLPKIAAQRDFWERGAAGAAGKAASIARRLPRRLASDEAARKTPAAPRHKRGQRGFLSNHGKSQAAACRDFREHFFPKISLRCDFREPCIPKRACLTDQEAVCLSPAAQTKTRHSGCRFSTSWSLTSSERACAVSILPCGKTLDLQGGSSSSQKSRCAAIFGNPISLSALV